MSLKPADDGFIKVNKTLKWYHNVPTSVMITLVEYILCHVFYFIEVQMGIWILHAGWNNYKKTFQIVFGI